MIMNALNFRIFNLIFCFSFIGMPLLLSANGTRLEGFEPDYAGRTIEFVTWSDPVSKNEKKAFSLRIGPQGRILVDPGITETIYCFADFDAYRGKMIITPGKTTNIKLPPLKEKSFEESKNPYFKPIEVWIMGKTDGNEDLSTLFARFDQRFYQLNDKYFNQIYFRQQKSYVDSIKIPLEKEFNHVRQPELTWHRQLQLKTVEAGMARAGRERIMATLPAMPDKAWDLPVFAELLDRIFSNALSLESKTTKGGQLRTMVAQKNVAGLKSWVESYSGTTPPFSDLVMLKMLHDAFYSGEFSKNAILQSLQASHFTGNPSGVIRKAAVEVLGKLQFLNPGSKAPEICLPSVKGDTLCSGTINKPYQYLFFADLEIPVCQEQIKYLAEINQRIQERVSMFVVLTPSVRINIAEFIRENKIPGNIVIEDPAKSISRRFGIKSYPSAILLNKEHKVVLSPAKSPLDGFELQMGGVRP
jgi:peroxiredoxin